MKIENILEEFKRICESTGIRPSENVLFEQAIKIYISNKIGENKKENIQSMKDINSIIKPSVKPSNEATNDNRPTDKQINFLINNGVKIDPRLTKKEATIMIQTLIKNKGGDKHFKTQRKQEQTKDYSDY